MGISGSEYIRKLAMIENQFLQLLLDRFTLVRKGEGAQLSIGFGGDTPAIWSRKGREQVHRSIPDFEDRAREYQQALDAVLLEGKRSCYEHNGPRFPFRYASGGTLPIIRRGDHDYYALFYREIFPIGWNIANGGCDTREELLDPTIAIERELREELIVVDTANRKRYVFKGDSDKPLDRPEFSVARSIWREMFPKLDFPRFQQVPLPLRWLNGPDRLLVHDRDVDRGPKVVDGVFLNINALDFGIEVDRIAQIHVDDDAILCDGEIIKGQLINAPIGLFRVDRFDEAMVAEGHEFLPDCFFFDAKWHPADRLGATVDRFVRRLDKLGVITRQDVAAHGKCAHQYDLCPATRSVMRRHVRSLMNLRKPPEVGEVDVFICFGGNDKTLARRVNDALTAAGLRSFFSEESSRGQFLKAIGQALDSATCMVVVGGSVENVQRPYPEYEYYSFHNDILMGKKRDSCLIPFVGFDCRDLPRPLTIYNAIAFERRNPSLGLKRLISEVREKVGPRTRRNG